VARSDGAAASLLSSNAVPGGAPVSVAASSAPDLLSAMETSCACGANLLPGKNFCVSCGSASPRATASVFASPGAAAIPGSAMPRPAYAFATLRRANADVSTLAEVCVCGVAFTKPNFCLACGTKRPLKADAAVALSSPAAGTPGTTPTGAEADKAKPEVRRAADATDKGHA
jgi:hypothetical protein